MIDVRRLSLLQLKILLRLWENPEKMGFAESHEEGGSVKELSKQGIVEATGKVRRRIRWKLVDGILQSKDIALMREILGLEHINYDLVKWTEGFEIVPGSLNLVCAFLVEKEDFVAGFAFRVGYLDWVTKQLKGEELIKKAKGIIKQYVDNGKVKDREELTFEYNHPGFLQVSNPKWWIKSNQGK